jgi:hypothetical protein
MLLAAACWAAEAAKLGRGRLAGRWGRAGGGRNISEFQAQVAAAMGLNQSLQAGSIEPSSHD